MPTNNAFEELFRERFGNLEETPPVFAWDKIRQEITPEPAAKTKPQATAFRWLVPVAAITVISFALLFWLKHNKAGESRQILAQMQLAPEIETAAGMPPVVPEKTENIAEKPAFRAYQPKVEKPEKATGSFVKKQYLKSAENPEILGVTANKKKLKATKVVWVVTVNPKSATVEKVSTAETDSVAVSGTAN